MHMRGPHTIIYVSSYYYMCPDTTIYVSTYYYIYVLILLCMCPHTLEPQQRQASIRQHTSAYVSIRQHASAYVSIRHHTSAYVTIRQHTSPYVTAFLKKSKLEKQHIHVCTRLDMCVLIQPQYVSSYRLYMFLLAYIFVLIPPICVRILPVYICPHAL
jgi:hypothetical protein